jgi:ketosteroid isomerase-like protein
VHIVRETPVHIVREVVSAWNRGDTEAAFLLFHEDAEIRSVLARSLHGDDVFRGLDGVRDHLPNVPG